MGKSKRSKESNAKQISRAARAAERKAFFEAGGTPQMWRGRAQTLDNKTKAKASKQACRSKVAWD